MRLKAVSFTTERSLVQVRDRFHDAAKEARGIGAKIGEMAAKTTGKDESGFFTPTFDSPFSTGDSPDFAVGVHIGKLLNGAQGSGTTIHLYVNDDGGTRTVQIVSPHSMTGGMRSAKFVRRFLESYQEWDARLQVVEGNV